MSFVFSTHFTSLIFPASHLQPAERSKLVEDAAWQRRQLVGTQVPVSRNARLSFIFPTLLHLSHLSSGTLTVYRAKQADRRCRLAATSTRWNSGPCQPKCTLEFHLSNLTSPLSSFQRHTYSDPSEASRSKMPLGSDVNSLSLRPLSARMHAWVSYFQPQFTSPIFPAANLQ